MTCIVDESDPCELSGLELAQANVGMWICICMCCSFWLAVTSPLWLPFVTFITIVLAIALGTFATGGFLLIFLFTVFIVFLLACVGGIVGIYYCTKKKTPSINIPEDD